jgi:hypothetical protein
MAFGESPLDPIEVMLASRDPKKKYILGALTPAGKKIQALFILVWCGLSLILELSMSFYYKEKGTICK